MPCENTKTNTRLRWEDLAGLSLHQQRQKLLERMANSVVARRKFWEKVTKPKPDDCWLWQGARYADGYGMLVMMVNYHAFGFRSHRVSFYLKNGYLPDDLFICHRCDTPTCVNPSHLFLGKQKQNMDDKVSKKRQAFNENHGRHKLTCEQVQKARKMHFLENKPLTQVAKHFGLCNSAMGSLLSGKNWKHLPWPAEIGMFDPMFT